MSRLSMLASVYGPFSDWHTATYVGRLRKPAVVGAVLHRLQARLLKSYVEFHLANLGAEEMTAQGFKKLPTSDNEWVKRLSIGAASGRFEGSCPFEAPLTFGRYRVSGQERDYNFILWPTYRRISRLAEQLTVLVDGSRALWECSSRAHGRGTALGKRRLADLRERIHKAETALNSSGIPWTRGVVSVVDPRLFDAASSYSLKGPPEVRAQFQRLFGRDALTNACELARTFYDSDETWQAREKRWRVARDAAIRRVCLGRTPVSRWFKAVYGIIQERGHANVSSPLSAASRSQSVRTH